MTSSLGAFCYRRRFTALLLWLLVLTGGVLSASSVFDAMQTESSSDTEASQGYDALDTGEAGSTYFVLIDHVTADDGPALQSALADAAQIDGIYSVGPPLPSADGNALLVQIATDNVGESDEAEAGRDKAITAATDRISETGLDVEVTGSPILGEQINNAVQSELATAEMISVPITLLVLTIVFGGLVAAAVPVLTAIATIIGSFLMLLVFSWVFDITTTSLTIVTMMGLALCIDYSLLLVSRFRDERAAGLDGPDAVRRTWATAGRTVMFSCLTVAASLGGLLVINDLEIRAVALAGVSAALLAGLTALTLSAVLLRLFGRRVTGKRAMRALRKPDEQGIFYRMARFGQRRPLVVIGGVGAVLLLLAAPLLGMKSYTPDLDGVPQDLPAVATLAQIEERFDLPDSDPDLLLVGRASAEELGAWATQWAGDERVASVGTPVDSGNGMSTVAIDLSVGAQSDAADELLGQIRADRPAYDNWVTGTTAVNHDLTQLVSDGLPWALLIIAGTMFVLLWLVTGSVVVPLKALLMNVLSIGAAMGLLVGIFQLGWLSGVLDTNVLPGMFPMNLVLIFAFAFGVSMDYELFLISRIKEYVDAGRSTDDAVAYGLQHTGRIITSAAILLAICFSGFTIGEFSTIEQIGFGMLLAILLDATLVRCLLVPATMSLLGKWNWWSPIRPPAALRETPELPPVPVLQKA